jgi:tRNA-Thr(GGU) m(6)t(6)A37 methyltransferase TsaA
VNDRTPKSYTDTVPFPEQVTLRPMAVVRSPYKERYGTPRQASVLDPGEREPQEGIIELLDWVPAPALKDLDGFDYIWVIALLHLNESWKPVLSPPRDPSRQGRGVLATRAPHRPNFLGLSALQLLRVQGREIHVRGLDLLDGTPVLDVKPYVPYADAFPEAGAGWVGPLGLYGGRNDRA